MTRPHLSRLGFATAVVLTALFASHCARSERPSTSALPQPRPSQQNHPAEPVPRLTGAGDAATRSVAEFLRWAGKARQSQREAARTEMAAAASNRDIVTALEQVIQAEQSRDHSTALLALSVLGEMRSPHAVPFLRRFLRQPLPRPGPLIEGEDPAQTGLATLQAKAVSGLAYLRSPEADQEVFWAVGQHESRIVRAEAIRAYMMNHDRSEAARATLLRYVRKGEESFVDRPNRNPGEGAASFNQKLEMYLQADPKRRPPAPESAAGKVQPGQESAFREPPPAY